jgi:hypothetical protein
MSGSIALSAATFTDAEKADIRRFCGYPAYGTGATGFDGWRFFTQYGELEFRMNNLAPAEYQVTRQYLAQLYTLETAIFNAGANLDTDAAAVWVHNKNEVRDRVGLFKKWRRELAGIIGVPAGPALGDGGFRVVV